VTYGLAFASSAFAGVVTDRRLTGSRRTEDSDKCGLVVYTDGRVAYTLTGFAGDVHGIFKTRIWLAEALCEAGRGSRSIDAALKRFAITASTDIAKMRFQNPDDGKLTVAFAGFTTGPFGNDMAVLRLVSNFETFGEKPSQIPRREFEVSEINVDLSQAPAHPICILPIGGASPSNRTLQPMFDALAQSVPPTLAIDAAVEIIRAQSTPDGTIGTWCSSVLLPRRGNQSSVVDYHPGEPRQILRLPTFIYAKYDNAGAFILAESRTEGTVGSGGALVRVPKVRRHEPCPCGSKRRFKDCHGGKQIAQKVAGMYGHVELKFKELPSEDVNLVTIASTSIALGPEPYAAIATLSGAPPFRIRQPPRAAGPTTESPSATGTEGYQ